MNKVIFFGLVLGAIFSFEVDTQGQNLGEWRRISDFSNDTGSAHITLLSVEPDLAAMSSWIALLDSCYNWQWDTVSNDWMSEPYSKRIEYSYSPTNDLIEYTYQTNYSGSGWVNSQKMSFTVDENGNTTSYLNQVWNTFNQSWENSSLQTNTYNFDNQVLTQMLQNWIGGEWVNEQLNIHEYDVFGYATTQIVQVWGGTNWENAIRYSYTWDNENRVSTMLREFWTGAVWENQFLSSYQYGQNGYTFLTQEWDGNGWIDFEQLETETDIEGNVIVVVGSSWSGTEWVIDNRRNNTYDLEGNVLSELYQSWENGDWVNDLIWTFTYDQHDLELSRAAKYWDETGSSIVSGDSTFNYFQVVAGIFEVGFETTEMLIYPNPGNGLFQVDLDGLEVCKVYDASGKLVCSSMNVNAKTIDLRGEPTGIYFLKALGTNGWAIQKLVKH